jgi:hypothetical protein
MSTDVWLKTPHAAKALGCSEGWLKRCRISHGGFLYPELHYALGATKTAPITWNVAEVRKAIHFRGLKVRAGEKLLEGLVAAAASSFSPDQLLSEQPVKTSKSIEVADSSLATEPQSAPDGAPTPSLRGQA